MLGILCYGTSTSGFEGCVQNMALSIIYVIFVLFYWFLCNMCKVDFIFEVTGDFVIFLLLYYDKIFLCLLLLLSI